MRVSVIVTMEASPALRAESALAFVLDTGPAPVPEPACSRRSCDRLDIPASANRVADARRNHAGRRES